MELGRDAPNHDLNAGMSPPLNARSAVGALFDAHAGVLHTYVAGRAGSAVADDVVSETFITAFRGWDTFDGSRGTARAWLFGIATNVLRHHWRSQERYLVATARLAGEIRPQDTTGGIDDRIHAAAMVQQLVPALTRLKQLDLDILLLNAWAGLEPTEIAESLGVPASTVRTKLRRTRRKLRAVIDLVEPFPLIATPTGDTDVT